MEKETRLMAEEGWREENGGLNGRHPFNR